MISANYKNERRKREYFEYLREAERKADSTIIAIQRAVAEYEMFVGFQDFCKFNKDWAVGYKKFLCGKKSKRTGSEINLATVRTALYAAKGFHLWLSEQEGYKSKIRKTDLEYFNMPEKEDRAARAGKFKQVATLEQIRRAVFSAPDATEIDRRNRALMACTILTGARVGALLSLRIKHLDFNNGLLIQDPAQVKTKFSKRIDSYFFPVGDDFLGELQEWIEFLKQEKGYVDDDPLFPVTKTSVNDDMKVFEVDGLDKRFWQTTMPANKIFRQMFERAGLPYFTPHSFRDTLVNLGQETCKTPEEFKVWSQNLGHESVTTTFTSYGKISTHKQGAIMKGIAARQQEGDKQDEISQRLARIEAAIIK